MKKPLLVAAGIIVAALVLVVSPVGVALSQDVMSVLVTNFPKVFNVAGSVSIEGPVAHSKFVALREVVVPPVSPKDTIRMVQGGPVLSDGFTAMMLGLQGQIKGDVFRPGNVGVFLLPDEDAVVHAFEEKGIMAFATELSVTGVSTGIPYFSSTSNSTPIAFPRYRTYFYNTTDKTVTVNLYAYLTN